MAKGILRYSNKTWHYKFMLWVWAWSSYSPAYKNGTYAYKIPRSLCPYMRKLVFGIPLAPFLYVWRKMPDAVQDAKDLAIVVVVISIIIHTIVFLADIIRVSAGMESMPWYTGWAVIFIGTFVITSLILICIGIIKVFSKTFDYIKCKRGDTEIKKPTTMCLVEDFLEAKHDKICPMIEFYDEDMENNKD